jgi:alpha-galactosidase
MFFDQLLQAPDQIQLEDGHAVQRMKKRNDGLWEVNGISLGLESSNNGQRVWLEAPEGEVKRICMRWFAPVLAGWRFLGDAWERGYGDLEWRGIVPERVMPWYVLCWDGRQAAGFGVKTGPSALVYWQVDGGGVRLLLDVRCGAAPVKPGPRRIELADMVVFHAPAGTGVFQAAQDFCRLLCPAPRLPAHPVYGVNDWYYAYGVNTAAQILVDVRHTAHLSAGLENRPFSVIDAGWSNEEGVSNCDTGIRTHGNQRFPDMPGLATEIKANGLRPGVWVRPLVAPPFTSPALCLRPAPDAVYAWLPILDPSLPENLETVAADFRRLTSWGYELIKHDFSTVDMLGRWGFGMGSDVTSPGWSFQDTSRTSAEIIRAFYQTIRDAAGDALIIGCNTIGHLSAGLFELSRTGDDTSGREWDRTRKMGVNTLAFRAPQHNTFFAADADCVGLTRDIPWHLNRQWLELLARSGTPLFVSTDPATLDAEQRAVLAQCFAQASQPQPLAEPLDWLDNISPARWRLGDETHIFNWYRA